MHTSDDVNRSLKKVMIRTVDTDVHVLATTFSPHIPMDEFRVAFGDGKNMRYLKL